MCLFMYIIYVHSQPTKHQCLQCARHFIKTSTYEYQLIGGRACHYLIFYERGT